MILTPPYNTHKELSGLHAPSFHATEVEFAQIIYWKLINMYAVDVVEIGVADGHLTWWLVQAMHQTLGEVTCVDPNAQLGNFLSKKDRERVSLYEIKSSEFFRLHKGMTYDLVVIDGGHEYNVCMEDYRNARSVLDPRRGVLVFHDTVFYAETVGKVVQEAMQEGGTWFHLPIGKGLSMVEYV